MKTPDISVVTPMYDTPTAYLDCLYRSLCRQTVNWEWIVVDDASINLGLVLHLSTLATTDPRVRVIRLEENQGGGHARNEGLKLARAGWVKFLDADDWLGDDLLSQELNHADDGADLIISMARVVKDDGNGEPTTTRIHAGFDDLNPMTWFLSVGSGHPGALLYRKSRAVEIGGWDPELRADQDGDFFARFISGGAVIRSNTQGHSIYRSHPGPRVGTRVTPRSILSRIKAHAWVEEHYRGPDARPGLRKICARRWGKIAYLSTKCDRRLVSDCLFNSIRYGHLWTACYISALWVFACCRLTESAR
jgi:glycosyltransferase involved in cell wall biosynthesis